MRKATLTRCLSSDLGTFGELLSDSGWSCKTGELPWRENLADKSCVPPGIYLCTLRMSFKHGLCYHLEGVPGRTEVEIHAANYMGDKSKGFLCQLEGCIAPGMSVGEINGQMGVISSRRAIRALEAEFARETFELTIV